MLEPRFPDPQLSMNFCFVKKGMLKLSPRYATEYTLNLLLISCLVIGLIFRLQYFVYSIHWGINLPQKSTPSFLSSLVINLPTVQSPFFRQFPLFIVFFCEHRPPLLHPSPLKKWIFQWTLIILNFFILNTHPIF